EHAREIAERFQPRHLGERRRQRLRAVALRAFGVHARAVEDPEAPAIGARGRREGGGGPFEGLPQRGGAPIRGLAVYAVARVRGRDRRAVVPRAVRVAEEVAARRTRRVAVAEVDAAAGGRSALRARGGGDAGGGERGECERERAGHRISGRSGGG